MAKVFLDVGAHTGETVLVAQQPRFGFERIFAFEPSSAARSELHDIALNDPRVVVLDYGLWNRDETLPLFSPGTIAASIYPDKDDVDPSDSETVSLRRASDWFSQNLDPGDRVWCKLNCEGAESIILEDLVASGRIADVGALRVHVDAGKVPSLGADQAAKTRATIRSFGNPRFFVDTDTPARTYPGAMAAWLCASGADALDDLTPKAALLRRLRYSLLPRVYMPAVRAGSRLKRKVIPYH